MSNINLLARVSILCLIAIACSSSASEESTYKEADECSLYKHFESFKTFVINENIPGAKKLTDRDIDEKAVDWMSTFFRDIQSLNYFHLECTSLSCTLSFKMTHKDTDTERLSIYFLRESDDYKINSVSYIHNSSTKSFDEGKTYKPLGFLDNCLINGSPLDSDTIN